MTPICKHSSNLLVDSKLTAGVEESKKVSACLQCSQVLKLYKMRPQAHLLRQEDIKEDLQKWTNTFEHCSQQFDKFDNDEQISRMALLRTTVWQEWTLADVEFVLGIYSRIVSENKKGKHNLEKIKKFTLNKLAEDSFIGGKGKLTASYSRRLACNQEYLKSIKFHNALMKVSKHKMEYVLQQDLKDSLRSGPPEAVRKFVKHYSSYQNILGPDTALNKDIGATTAAR